MRRHKEFRRKIAEKAEALAKSKMESAVVEMVAAFKPQAQVWAEPEPMPPPQIERPIWFAPAAAVESLSSRLYPRVQDIQRAVCSYYGISRMELMSPRRAQPLTLYRQIAFYLCKELTPLSLPFIGDRFGGRDHTTVLHGLRKIARLLPHNEQLAFDVASLIEQITGTQQ
jgi:hypothetical protein